MIVGIALCKLAVNKIIKRSHSILLDKFMNSKEIIYRKNVDIICKNNIFFYTILNVDEYKHFLPYVTDSEITYKCEEYFNADLQIENIIFKERYKSIIKYKYPTTITVSTHDTSLFYHLITEWDIKDKQSYINVNFYINFKVNPIHNIFVYIFSWLYKLIFAHSFVCTFDNKPLYNGKELLYVCFFKIKMTFYYHFFNFICTTCNICKYFLTFFFSFSIIFIFLKLKNKLYQNFMNLYIKELGRNILYAFIKEAKSNSLKNVDSFFSNLKIK